MSISYCIQCNCLHLYIAPEASSSTASSGATLIKDNRRFHAAQPPLLAWPALLSLSKYPDSARRSVPALWLAGTVPLAYSQSNLGYDQGTSKPSADLAASGFSSPTGRLQFLRPPGGSAWWFLHSQVRFDAMESNAFDDSMTSTISVRSSRWSSRLQPQRARLLYDKGADF